MHLAQLGDVDGEPGVVGGGLLGVAELVADLPGQVLGGGHQLAGGRVVEDQRAELGAGVVARWCRAAGRSRRRSALAAGVQADGQRVGRGVGAEPGSAGGDDPLRGRSRPWRPAGRPGRTPPARTPAGRTGRRGTRPAAAGSAPWLGSPVRRVGAAGAPQGVPVQRPVGGEVAVVAAAQLGPQPADLGVSSAEAASASSRARAVSRRPSSCRSSAAWLRGTACGRSARARPW